MEIESVFELVAAIVRQAVIDSNIDRRISREFSRTCDATGHNHPARNCAQEFLMTMEPFKTAETDWTAMDYCLGVMKEIWQQ